MKVGADKAVLTKQNTIAKFLLISKIGLRSELSE